MNQRKGEKPLEVSVLSEAMKDGINILETFSDFGFGFGSGEDDFAIDEDEENDAWLHHSVNEPWEQFRLITRELTVHLIQIFQSNGKPEVDGRHQVLNFEVDKLDLVAKLLNNSRKFSRC